MKHLRKFLRLPVAERRLLVKAALLLVAIRLGLWLLPFRTLRRLLARATETSVKADKVRPSTDSIIWTVGVASQYMHGFGTCLTQALAAQVLLARRSIPSLLHIGVLRDERGRLQAHAWLESGGKVVIGEHEIERYTPLVALDKEKP